jgi:hypothetical protein
MSYYSEVKKMNEMDKQIFKTPLTELLAYGAFKIGENK